MMSQLFSAVAEEQQEKISGGWDLCGPVGAGQMDPWGPPIMEMPSMPTPFEPGPPILKAGHDEPGPDGMYLNHNNGV